MTLAEKCLIKLAEDNVALDGEYDGYFVEKIILPYCSKATLDAVCAYPNSPAGKMAVSLRAKDNWQALALAAAKQTPLAALKKKWEGDSPGMQMLKALPLTIESRGIPRGLIL